MSKASEYPYWKQVDFEPHVRSLWEKTGQKVNAFARLACSLKFDQRKLLLNAFITSRFSYATVVWMFHNRKLNNHINQIHERTLKIAYQDHNSKFNELYAKYGTFKIHDRNLQRLLVEIFTVKMKLAPKIMNEVFDIIEFPYPLRFKWQTIRIVWNWNSCFCWLQDMELHAQWTEEEYTPKRI